MGLFISTTAYRLTLKCHCYSSLALWETIKNTPLNPIYKLSARLCVCGKLHRVVQHIKTDWTASSDHVTHKISILSEAFCKCSRWVNMYACSPISVWLHATQWEKIEGILIFQCLQEAGLLPPCCFRNITEHGNIAEMNHISFILTFFSFPFFSHQSGFWNGAVSFPYQPWFTENDGEMCPSLNFEYKKTYLLTTTLNGG